MPRDFPTLPAWKVLPEYAAAVRDAEAGALTGALDRAWYRLSRKTRSEINFEMLGRPRTIRTLAAHPLIIAIVVEELTAAADKSARFVAEIGGGT